MDGFAHLSLVERALDDVTIPRFVRVRQRFERTSITDFYAAIKAGVADRGLEGCLAAGRRIAITAGSRQIRNVPEILRAVVRVVREAGCEPFIMPAMGSHGGATDEGQAALLASYGIREESIGAPIVSSMRVQGVGALDDGSIVYCSETALLSDGVILLNRVKAHPGLFGPYQSGLVKMSVIGLGKQKGAESIHRMGADAMPERMLDASRVLFARAPILFGVAILENAYDETAEIRVLPKARIHEEEPALLEHSRSLLPSIIPSPLDVLVVDRVGKNISGVCADPNVTMRFLNPKKRTGRPAPKRLVMSNLTEESGGSASGVGQADVITKRLFDQIDFGKTYINSMTSTNVHNPMVPVVMRNDLYALKFALKTCNLSAYTASRIVRIKSTLDVEEIYVSEPLMQELSRCPMIAQLTEPTEQTFDQEGNYIDF